MKRTTQLYIGLIVLLILCIGYFFLGSNMAIPAQTADNILRPLVGGRNTITIEYWYFALGDKIKQIEYTFLKPNAHVFTSAAANRNIFVSKSVKNDSSMDLTNITPNKNFPPIAAEGIWQTIPESLFSKKLVMAKTFMRPDSSRSYAIVSLVKIDMSALSLGVVAGTYYPGGSYHMYGPGFVPKNIRESNNLIAVFNGGFMERDGHYGMIVGNKTYVPLRNGLATLAIYRDGSANIINYQGKPFDKNVIAARQNGAFLIKNGKMVPFVENGVDTWGRTTTNSIYTWRSGIGITKNGNLIYAVGNSLVPQTLATALKDAGAQNAMQLDINPFWVRFILYYSKGNGQYSYYPLLQNMQNGGYSYLHGYNKDFFYVYKKS